MFDWKTPFTKKHDSAALVNAPSIHEQPDGTVLAMCITGTGTKDSLISWIKFLQVKNHHLYVSLHYKP